MSTPALTADRLFSPLGLSQFITRYWSREHLVIRRRDAAFYGDLFRLADVDRYVALGARAGGAFIAVIRDGRIVRRPRAEACDVQDLMTALDDGATLLFEEIDRLWPPVREFAASLGQGLSARVKVNAYLTPPGKQGAPIHPDVQDVFVLQVAGAKEWWLYEERLHEAVETLEHATDLGYRRPVLPNDLTPLETLTLEAGDLLYLPRGLLHRAIAPEDLPSLHLTVCVTPTYWVDLLKVAVEACSLADSRFAAPLPPEFEAAAGTTELQQQFAAMLAALQETASLEATLAAFERRRDRAAANAPDGRFEQLMEVDAIDRDSRLVRRLDAPMRVMAVDGRVELRCGAKRLRGPATLRPAFELICERPALQVSDLPEELGESGRLVLVRRLVREGLLKLEPA